MWSSNPMSRRHSPLAMRADQRDWENCWQTLSSAARLAFLDGIRDFHGFTPLGADFLAAKVLEYADLVAELSAAGLLHKGRELRVADEACPFSGRLACLVRDQLLRDPGGAKLQRYLTEFFPYGVLETLMHKVAAVSGLSWFRNERAIKKICLPSRHWIDWVRRVLKKDSLSLALLDLLIQAPGPVLLADLGKLAPIPGPNRARAAHEVLLAHLVTFEDIDPSTGLIQVGLLPAVRASLQRQANPPPRPELVPQPTPTILAPERGSDLVDLRAFLLELIARPARLLQGSDELYLKDIERLAQVLEPLSPELTPPEVDAHLDADEDEEDSDSDDDYDSDEDYDDEDEEYYLGYEEEDDEEDEDEDEEDAVGIRVERAFRWAWRLNLARPTSVGQKNLFQITADGQAWLQLSLPRQFAAVAERLRKEQQSSNPIPFAQDSPFLSCNLAVSTGKRVSIRSDAYLAQQNALRQAIYSAFRALPADAFVRVDDFLAHAAFGRYNPLLLGHAPTDVTISLDHEIILPLEEVMEKACRDVLYQVLRQRLVPLGALRFGINDAGEEVIARTPRLVIYFGHQPDKEEAALVDEAPTGSRVVVQPDFSVILIGQDPAPAADLLPFCERARGSVDQGSLLLRITRETVLRAVAEGLPGKTILERLQKHSSTPLPANVLEEVRGWCALVAQIHAAPATLIRCADSALADRVFQALGKYGERVGPTVVAINAGKLTPALRQRLRAQGLIPIDGLPDTPTSTSKKKK